jgi:YHS domain-containing protein
MTRSSQASLTYIDPVCLMKVSGDDNASRYTYKYRTYYFCADSCRKAFIDNPQKYLDAKPEKRKGWWVRYLARLNKTTDGKPQKCCH